MGVTVTAREDVWVFAYGSLMWQPDFLHVETAQARLYGWHREMCILSHFYRGTVECPGLVLGLDRGGSCRGVAFRVRSGDWPSVRDFLHDREMINDVYVPTMLPIELLDGRKVRAHGFVADRRHGQFWRGSAEQAAKLIAQGVGSRGSAVDYLRKTCLELKALGIRDRGLERLVERVQVVS